MDNISSLREILTNIILKMEKEVYKNPNYSSEEIGEKKNEEDDHNA